MLRGMDAIKGVVEQHKKQLQSGGYIRHFKLEDGETGLYIFLANDRTQEPAIVFEHSMRDGKKFGTIGHREEQCVACWLNAGGDRRIGKASPKGCFSLYDLRWAKKIRDEKRSAEAGQDRFEYRVVDEDQVTEKGKARGIFVRRGKCGWKASPQWSNALMAIDNQAGKRCKSCLRGKIILKGYEKPDGTRVNVRDKDEDEIRNLLRKGKIVESIQCSACDNPVRKSIFNSVVAITRAGADTNTTYQFEILAEEEIPEDVVAAIEAKDSKEGPYDWETLLAEPSPEEQARQLGVKNPFGKSKKEASSYDDDDEDEADESDEEDDVDDDDEDVDPFADEDDEESLEDDDDEDEDEAPRKKKVVKRKVSTKTPTKKKQLMMKKKGIITKVATKKKVTGGGTKLRFGRR